MFTTGKTIAQVSIRWLLQTPPVTSVIVGATKIHQLEDNMGTVGWRLTQEEVSLFSYCDLEVSLLCTSQTILL